MIKVGIVGCGAIGSGIARSIRRDMRQDCRLAGLYDTDGHKAQLLAKNLGSTHIRKRTLKDLIKTCDVVVEAVNAPDTADILRQALRARKSVIAMSVGKLLNAPDLFQLAKTKKCHLLVPSGAIAGIDAIKAASLRTIRKITLTTRKPLKGFSNNTYLARRGIDPAKIKKETVLFKGKVAAAVKHFPQNINVAATLALASKLKDKLTVTIMTSPFYKDNAHEIHAYGDFGHLMTRTDNRVSPDNPKTSYLAVLSGIQTLKQFCEGVHIGT